MGGSAGEIMHCLCPHLPALDCVSVRLLCANLAGVSTRIMQSVDFYFAPSSAASSSSSVIAAVSGSTGFVACSSARQFLRYLAHFRRAAPRVSAMARAALSISAKIACGVGGVVMAPPILTYGGRLSRNARQAEPTRRLEERLLRSNSILP